MKVHLIHFAYKVLNHSTTWFQIIDNVIFYHNHRIFLEFDVPAITDIIYGDPVFINNYTIQYPITLKSPGNYNLNTLFLFRWKHYNYSIFWTSCPNILLSWMKIIIISGDKVKCKAYFTTVWFFIRFFRSYNILQFFEVSCYKGLTF